MKWFVSPRGGFSARQTPLANVDAMEKPWNASVKRKREHEMSRTSNHAKNISRHGKWITSRSDHKRLKQKGGNSHPNSLRGQSSRRGYSLEFSNEKPSWLFSDAQLAQTPSIRHGISLPHFRTALYSSCKLIETLGKKLSLKSNPVLATAQVFLRRFFSVQSLQDHDRTTVAITCLFVAAKIEDGRKRFCDTVVAALFLWKKTKAKKGSHKFNAQKQLLFLYETILLQTLGFDLNVVHPYTFLPSLVKSIQLTGRSADSLHKIANLSTSIVHDSFKTDLCVRFSPRKIAATAVFMATRLLSSSPLKKATLNHKDVPWRKVFQLKISDIDSITSTYFDLYQTLYAPAVRTKLAQKLAAYNPDNKQITNLANAKISRDKMVASTAAVETIEQRSHHGSTGIPSDDTPQQSHRTKSSTINNTAGNQVSAKSQLSLAERATTDNDKR